MDFTRDSALPRHTGVCCAQQLLIIRYNFTLDGVTLTLMVAPMSGSHHSLSSQETQTTEAYSFRRNRKAGTIPLSLNQGIRM